MLNASKHEAHLEMRYPRARQEQPFDRSEVYARRQRRVEPALTNAHIFSHYNLLMAFIIFFFVINHYFIVALAMVSF